jgi:ferrous iron transport protein A
LKVTFKSDAFPVSAALAGEAASDAAERSLARVEPGGSASIVAVDLEPEQAGWLGAVGIGVGETVTVIRRAAFGGPIHLRTASGGEFALARSLAEAIRARPRR